MTDERGWVPIALSGTIEASTSTGVIINGEEIVVWRDSKGAAHVWEDRCPHRGMRMSFGFVRGDHIACLYHGWQYDTGGQCQYIPAHPDLEVPKTIKIPTYAVTEKGGIIWTSLASEGADPAELPDVAGSATPVRSLYVDCPLDRALSMLARTALPGETTGAQYEAIRANLVSLSSASLKLLIALQPIGPAKTGLHMVLIDSAPGAAARVAKWAEALRLSLENQADLAEVA